MIVWYILSGVGVAAILLSWGYYNFWLGVRRGSDQAGEKVFKEVMVRLSPLLEQYKVPAIRVRHALEVKAKPKAN
jgi:hypothetical protein